MSIPSLLCIIISLNTVMVTRAMTRATLSLSSTLTVICCKSKRFALNYSMSVYWIKLHCNCFPLHQEINCFILLLLAHAFPPSLLIKILISTQSHKTLRLLKKKMPKRLELNFPTYIKCQDSPIHVRTKIQFNFLKLSPRLEGDAESSKTK